MLRIFETHAIDSILHFAAKVVVPELMVDPLAYYLNNTVKTRALLEAAVAERSGISFFHRQQRFMAIQNFHP